MKRLPVVGNTWAMLRRPWDFLQDCYRQYGSTYTINVVGRNAVVLAGPDVRDLYSEAGDNFLDRSFFYKRFQEELGANTLVFRAKGAEHSEQRRLTGLAYSRHIAAENLPGCAAEIRRYSESLVPGRRYDAMRLTTEALIIAGGPMIGHCNLRPILREAYVYSDTLMQVAVGLKTPMALWSPAYRRAKRRAFAFGHELLAKWRRGELGADEESCVVGCLGEARTSTGAPVSDDDIVSTVLLNLLGLSVYTNRIVAFMLYELFCDDELRKALVAEVDRVYADGVTYEALSSLTLLRAVYHETLRRYPIWFLVPFRAEQSFEFSGKSIWSGELLLLSSVQEHFLPENYPEPGRFDHTRCLPPRNEHLRRGVYAPFGAGNRRCVATGQVEILSQLLVSMLLHRTRFSADPDYRLRVRVRPLPAPRGFRLRFDGLRTPVPAAHGDGPAPRSGIEVMEAASERLAGEDLEHFRRIADHELHVRVFAPGVEVFHQGDPPDAFYIVEAGRVDVIRTGDDGRDEHLATLGPGDVFGELGLMRKRPRSATISVVGDEPLVTLRCDADAFERLLAELNLVGSELIGLIRRRKVAGALGRLVPGLNRAQIRELVPDAEFRRGGAGDVFVRQGDPSEALHVIERGRFEVVEESASGARRRLATLGKGDLFGEMGLLRNAPRSATVSVAPDCDDAETLVISKAAFLKLVEPGSAIRERVFRDMGRRDAANRVTLD